MPYVLSIVLTLVFSVDAMGEADTSPDPSKAKSGSVVATPRDTARAKDYWTPQRMRDAKPTPLPQLEGEPPGASKR